MKNYVIVSEGNPILLSTLTIMQADLVIVLNSDDTFSIIKNRWGANNKIKLPLDMLLDVLHHPE